MSLRSYVRDFAARARRNPGLAAQPSELDALIKRADESFDGAFYATCAPNAPVTWEIKSVLLNNQNQSDRKVFPAPYKVEIVGFLPTLTVLNTQSGGTVTPTTDDVDVSIDINGQRFLTSTKGANNSNQGSDGSWVTLTSMGVRQRTIRVVPDAAQPDIGVTFRWKQPSGVYKDSLLCLAVFCRPVDA